LFNDEAFSKRESMLPQVSGVTEAYNEAADRWWQIVED
jgi:hypothetical protein